MKIKMDKSTKLTCVFSLIFLIGGGIVLLEDENHFKFSDEVLYLEDNICAINATDKRSDLRMRADVEECIRLRKESKK